MKIERDEKREPVMIPGYLALKAIEEKEAKDEERKNKILKFKSFFRDIFSL